MRIRPLSLYISSKSIYSNRPDIEYRLFSKRDSIDELTALINLSYRANAEKGMNFVGATQNSKITKKRIRGGVCIIALHQNRIIATMTFKAPHKTKGCPWYNKSTVAKRNLLAVSPDFQKKGIASHLIVLTEILAKKHGAEEIAIDTAENNTTLFEYYRKNGYRYIENVKWETTNYMSVIYSKQLVSY